MKFLLKLLALLLLASTCFAFDISGIRGFGTENLSGYPEISGMRQNIMLSYYSQGRDSLPPGFPEFANASLDFMQKFSNAYSASTSQDPLTLLSLQRSVGLASVSLENMGGLAMDSIPLSKYTAYLARSAFERYISTEAGRLKDLGDSEPQTKKKIAFYDAASNLYAYSDDRLKAAEARAEYTDAYAAYVSDMGRADSIYESSASLCARAEEERSLWFGLPSYASLRQCVAGLEDAKKTYVANLESDKLAELNSKLASAQSASDSLSRGVILFFITLALALVALNALVLSRIRTWNSDAYDSSLGSEVLRWKKG